MIINWDCGQCPNKAKCRKLCPPVEFAANNKYETKEVLFSSLTKKDIETTEFKDYNLVLSELMTDKEQDFDKILFIADLKKRAIAAMLYVNISREDIADLLHIHLSSVYRILSGKK